MLVSVMKREQKSTYIWQFCSLDFDQHTRYLEAVSRMKHIYHYSHGYSSSEPFSHTFVYGKVSMAL